MVRWYYQSIFDELEEMRRYMEALTREMSEFGPRTALLPAPGQSGAKLLPAARAGLRVDVTESEKDIIVTADMIPGIAKKDITLTLIDPQSLEISAERKEEKKEEKEGYFLHERRFGSMARVVPLPKAVAEEGSTATFKNGVLEVHLKKSTKEQKGKISIE